jgi:hypothetical protein
MPVPNRHETAPPWWENNMTVWAPMDGNDFRKPMTGSQWQMGPDDGDPRLTPSGDVARRGTIPAYVPYAILNPGVISSVPQ